MQWVGRQQRKLSAGHLDPGVSCSLHPRGLNNKGLLCDGGHGWKGIQDLVLNILYFNWKKFT